MSQPADSPNFSPGPLRPEPLDAQADRSPPVEEEVDVWWGSYSGWTMLPSTVVCLVLTGLIALGAWRWLREWMHLAFLGLAGAVWLVQGIRWGYRFFTFNYRLTSRRLFCEKGFLYLEMIEVPLTQIAAVAVIRGSLEKMVRVGRIVIGRKDGQPPLVLEGVRHPTTVAELIREWCQRGKESNRSGVVTLLRQKEEKE